MEADYECPKCHNIFPSQNRVMHDARCTEENPMPLDKSRQIQLENQNNSNINKDLSNKEKKPEVIPKKEIPKEEPKSQPPLKKSSESGEFPNIFVCEICGETLAESEKKDHMYCHKLETEERNQINNENNLEVSQGKIEEQKKIERLINQQNEMRRQMQNQQNQRQNPQNQNPNPNQNLNRNQLSDSDINMLNQSDMQFFGGMGMPGISQTTITTNSQNNPNGTAQIRIIRSGPNGQTIVQQFSGNSSNFGNMMDPMMMNDPFSMGFSNFSGNQRTNRLMIPFLNLSNMGGMEDIFQSIMNRMRNHENPTDQQILDELPETQIEDVTKLDPEKKNCVICLEDFKNGDKATVLPCIHLFHTPCVQNWLKTQNCCPICKFKLTGENLGSQNN